MENQTQKIVVGQYSFSPGLFVKASQDEDSTYRCTMTTSRDRFCEWIIRDSMREDLDVQLAKVEVERRARLDAALKSLESRMKFHNRVYFRIKYFIQKTLDRYGL